jgi:hypothetical protein
MPINPCSSLDERPTGSVQAEGDGGDDGVGA